MSIKFVANAVKWFDRVNGNTYHSVRITRCRDNKVIACPFTYGYGDHYRQTALQAMNDAGWLPRKYGDSNYLFSFERLNNYPIMWNVRHGLKRECVANGEL